LEYFNQAISHLIDIKPLLKPRLLQACIIAITADRKITSQEIELFRAIAISLDCPTPPIPDMDNAC
jgi:hypothetical protein